MKKQILSTLVLLTCLIFPFSLHSQEQQRKKVGVVLSGGGAKGMAHIKALKVIEEAGIPIDYIAGTSIDRKSTRLNSSHNRESRMPSSA